MSSVRSLIIAPCAIVSPGDWHICSIAGVSYSINGLVKPYNLRRVRLSVGPAGGVSLSPPPPLNPSVSAAVFLGGGRRRGAPPLSSPPPRGFVSPHQGS